MNRLEVALKMEENGLVPVFYDPRPEVCKAVIKACYNGGSRVFEFTNRGDFAAELFSELNKWAKVECPEMVLGVGSVIDEGTAALYLSLGAGFIVAPLIDKGTARVCNKRKVLWIPGCGTVTEISIAHELGAEIVKIFPGEQVGGPDFVKAVLGPMPWTSIMPTGGVIPNEENLSSWFKAGVKCVGIGSKLITSDMLSGNNMSPLTIKVAETIAIIKKIRS